MKLSEDIFVSTHRHPTYCPTEYAWRTSSYGGQQFVITEIKLVSYELLKLA